jgi:hypothetical protein
VLQTHSSLVKTINELTEEEGRFIVKRKLLVNHETGWRPHERLLLIALEACWLTVSFIVPEFGFIQ